MTSTPRVKAILAYLPLLGHVVPTLVIGFGFVIPGSCIEGWNPLTLGFAAAVAGFVPAYAVGMRLAARR